MTTTNDKAMSAINFLAQGDWPTERIPSNKHYTLFEKAWDHLNKPTAYSSNLAYCAYEYMAELTMMLCRDLRDNTLTEENLQIRASTGFSITIARVAMLGGLGSFWQERLDKRMSVTSSAFLEDTRNFDRTFMHRMYPFTCEFLEAFAYALIRMSVDEVFQANLRG